jgi:hypothetical protein
MTNPEQANSNEQNARIQLAYPPYETFRGFVESLNKTALPDKINKDLMDNYSGGVKSHLMIALRFLGLIKGPDNRVQPEMKELVNAIGDKEAWPKMLAKVIEPAYQPVIHELNMATITPKDLDDAFIAASRLEGTMLERAERFYLKARADAKLPTSPHLLKRKPRTVVKRSNGKSSSNGKPSDVKIPTTESIPQGTIKFPIYFKGKPQGSLVVPENLTASDVSVIELMIPMLKAYAGNDADLGG